MNQKVSVTLLGDPLIRISARAANGSGKGMCIVTDRPLPCGAAVKIDGDDMILLGEVIYCRPGIEEFQIGVKLDQVLYQVSELRRLTQRLMGEDLEDAFPVESMGQYERLPAGR